MNICFDCVLQVGNHSLNAHRAVLACSSMYLYELFSEDEAIKQTIKLKVLDYHSFVALVDYAYTARSVSNTMWVFKLNTHIVLNNLTLCVYLTLPGMWVFNNIWVSNTLCIYHYLGILHYMDI